MLIEKTLLRILKIDLMAARHIYGMGALVWLNQGEIYDFRKDISNIFHQLLYRKEKYHKEERLGINTGLEEYRM